MEEPVIERAIRANDADAAKTEFQRTRTANVQRRLERPEAEERLPKSAAIRDDCPGPTFDAVIENAEIVKSVDGRLHKIIDPVEAKSLADFSLRKQNPVGQRAIVQTFGIVRGVLRAPPRNDVARIGRERTWL